jgi:amino acid transporter
MKPSSAPPIHPQAQDLRRVIGFFGGTAVIVGITIGSGIFRTPPIAIMLAIMTSVFGALNGNLLAKPRVASAMARDGLIFSFLGKTHARWSTHGRHCWSRAPSRSSWFPSSWISTRSRPTSSSWSGRR